MVDDGVISVCRENDFGDMVRDTIEQAGITPNNPKIEIAESLLLDQGNPVEELPKRRDSGVRLSIHDDFGTGCSALSYLRRFQVDALKIDRTFLSNLPMAAKTRPWPRRLSPWRIIRGWV